MKTNALNYIISLFLSAAIISCGAPQDSTESGVSTVEQAGQVDLKGQSGVQDDESDPNIVQVAVGSEDHTTLVAAVQAAELVDVLVNAGPFTVFAPTNAAFDALPEGTVEGLLKPENKDALSDILQYHVAVAVLKTDYLLDGQELEMVNGGFVKITKNGDEVMINDAKIIASVEASNGLIHVVDKVLLENK